MNTKGSILYYIMEDTTIPLPNGNVLSDALPALDPVYDQEGNLIGSEPSQDLSIDHRVRNNHLAENPFWSTPEQCARVADAVFPYTGEVGSMQGRSFHKIPVVVDDIELWVLTIKQIREAHQAAVGKTFDKPEGHLINAITFNEHFGGENEL